MKLFTLKTVMILVAIIALLLLIAAPAFASDDVATAFEFAKAKRLRIESPAGVKTVCFAKPTALDKLKCAGCTECGPICPCGPDCQCESLIGTPVPLVATTDPKPYSAAWVAKNANGYTVHHPDGRKHDFVGPGWTGESAKDFALAFDWGEACVGGTCSAGNGMPANYQPTTQFRHYSPPVFNGGWITGSCGSCTGGSCTTGSGGFGAFRPSRCGPNGCR